jgi:tellurite methyltransferase
MRGLLRPPLFRGAKHANDLGYRAEAGLAEVGRKARAENLNVSTHAAPMTALPFDDGTFDVAVAFNVIYHGDDATVRTTASEIRRVLRAGGLYYGTMISKRTLENLRSHEISFNTFMREGDTEDDKHPHYYCSANDVLDVFDGFRLCSLEERAHRTHPASGTGTSWCRSPPMNDPDF